MSVVKLKSNSSEKTSVRMETVFVLNVLNCDFFLIPRITSFLLIPTNW